MCVEYKVDRVLKAQPYFEMLPLIKGKIVKVIATKGLKFGA